MDTESRLEKVRAAIRRLDAGVHACTFYDGREEEVGWAATYVHTGLERGELCVCIVDDGEQRIREGLAAEGIDVEAELRAGHLIIFHKPTSLLRTRDMDKKIDEWAEKALAAGFKGCRVTGEMTWALDEGLKELAEFEARLNLSQVWERHTCIGMCQFDVRRFTPEMIREMIVLHPFVVVGDRICHNPYYVVPESYLSPDWPLHETDWMIGNLERLQEAEDSLRDSREDYRSLTHRLVSLQDTERRDIARELHDRVGQNLTAMRINIDLIRARLDGNGDAQIRARAEDSMRLIDSTFKAVQNVMYDLRPPMLDEYGLGPSLRWYAKEFTDRTGIRVETFDGDDLRLGPDAEIALFRIAQEALNNAARHSQAKNMRIDLRQAEAETVFTVQDDGAGFDAERARPAKVGYGLVTMRERAEAVGGTFAMSSEKGRGTRITVKVPRLL
jgi:signal transduction histidine kinase